MTTHILFHRDCADGFAAACIARDSMASRPGSLEFHPVSYNDAQQAPPKLHAYQGDEVFYLDYTPPASTIADLLGIVDPDDEETSPLPEVSMLTIMDHHSTATKIHSKLVITPELPVRSIFDLNSSGSDLAWRHFFGQQTPRPPTLSLLSFYDLGGPWEKHADPAMSEIAQNLQAGLMRGMPRTFDAWLPVLMCEPGGEPFVQAVELGETLRAADSAVIQAAVEAPLWLVIAGHRVPAIANLPAELTNAACDQLFARYSGCAFAVSFFVDGRTGVIRYRLRSREGGVNVAEIAKLMEPPSEGRSGGGGHPCAAGFTSIEPLPIVR